MYVKRILWHMNAHNTLTRDVRLVGMLSSDWRAGPSRLSNKKRDVAYEKSKCSAALLCENTKLLPSTHKLRPLSLSKQSKKINYFGVYKEGKEVQIIPFLIKVFFFFSFFFILIAIVPKCAINSTCYLSYMLHYYSPDSRD